MLEYELVSMLKEVVVVDADLFSVDTSEHGIKSLVAVNNSVAPFAT